MDPLTLPSASTIWDNLTTPQHSATHQVHPGIRLAVNHLRLFRSAILPRSAATAVAERFKSEIGLGWILFRTRVASMRSSGVSRFITRPLPVRAKYRA